MADIAPEPTTEPAPEPIAEPNPRAVHAPFVLPPLPWWAPGAAVGAVAALVALLAGVIEVSRDPAPRGAYRATARVLVRPVRGETAVSDADRQRIAFLARDRDLIARALAVPDIAALRTVSTFRDPVLEIDRRLAVEVTEGGVVSVGLVGDDPQDLTAILDQVVARFVDEHAALGHKARDEQVNRLEKVAAALRDEIDARKDAIERVARATGASPPAAVLREHLNQLETELAKGAPELALLEHRAETLKKRRANGAPLDPVAAAQLVDVDPRVAPLLAQRADAAVAVSKERVAATGAATAKDLQAKLDRADKALAAAREPVQKEVDALLRAADARRTGRELEETEVRLASAKSARAALQAERDATRKALAAAHAPGTNAEDVSRALRPFQDQADQIAAQLALLRADGPTAQERARVAGPALVEQNPEPGRWSALIGAALRTFAATFGLVTAFQLTGLVFYALRPASGARSAGAAGTNYPT